MRFLSMITLCLTFILGAQWGIADELVLKNGGRIKGVIVEENATDVVIKIGGGKMRLSRKKIKEIIRDKKSDNKKLKEKQKETFQGGKTASPTKKLRSPTQLFEQMKVINQKPKTRLAHFAKFIVPSERKVYALSLVFKAYALAPERGADAEAALKKIAARFKVKDPSKQGQSPSIQNLVDAKKRADSLIQTTNYLALIGALDGFFQTYNKEAYLAMKVVTEVEKVDVKENRGLVTLKGGQKVPITKLADGWYLSMRNLP